MLKDGVKEIDLFTYDRDDFYRYVEVEGGIKVVGYTGNKFHVAIPETIHGKTVVAMGVENGKGKNETDKVIVKIPNTVHTIDPETTPCFQDAWYEEIVIEEDNPYWSLQDGYLYSKDLKTLHIAYGEAENDEIVIPEWVEHISAYAFYNFTMKSYSYSSTFTLTLPSNLKSIGDGAFLYARMKPIKIPASVEQIGTRIYSQYEISSESPYFMMKDDCVYSKDQKVLIQCLDSKCEQLTLSDEVEEILPYACAGLNKLSKVEFGKNIKRIGEKAFFDTKVKTLRFPASLEYLSSTAFS